VTAFRYTALGPDGARTTGALDAPSESAALAELQRRQLTPLDIAPGSASGWRTGTQRGERIPQPQLARAYTQLSDLLRAGVPLLRALRLLANRKSTPALARVFSSITESVEDGDDLAEAMSAHPGAFRPIHIAMIRAGEKGAFLEQALARLAGFVQGQVELRQKVTGALIYPAAIVVIGGIILGVLFVAFVPMFEERFAGVELQLPTLIVMGISDVLVHAWPLVLLAVGGTVGGLWWAMRQPELREKLTLGLCALPIIGPLLRALAVARFARILGTLLESGVPMLASLKIAKDAAGIPAMAHAIEEATRSVSHGQRLSEPLAESGLFGEDVVEMIAVAESANNLDAVLPGIADTLESRVARRLDVAVKLIEPMTIVAIGATIAFVAFGLLLPIIKLASGQGSVG
jgi:general secretion pathway protein F